MGFKEFSHSSFLYVYLLLEEFFPLCQAEDYGILKGRKWVGDEEIAKELQDGNQSDSRAKNQDW